MRKLRSDALWHKLTPEQQAKIEHWFFEEHLSYRQVHERMKRELGITCARSIIGPMYHHCREARSGEREAILDRLSRVITEPGVDLSRIRVDSLGLIVERLMQHASEQDDSREIAALGRVLLQAEEGEMRRKHLAWMRENQRAARPKAAVRRAASGAAQVTDATSYPTRTPH